MARPASKYPTELELEMLKIIWRIGPSTGRQVQDALVSFRDLAYTSVLTILNIMTRKGYLKRSRGEGGYVYSARVTEHSTTGRMLRDMVDRVFNGSASALMLKLLETADLDPDELKQLRKLINRKAEDQS
jgi:BlaI family transcriptional regulator, penicillinase repressor